MACGRRQTFGVGSIASDASRLAAANSEMRTFYSALLQRVGCLNRCRLAPARAAQRASSTRCASLSPLSPRRRFFAPLSTSPFLPYLALHIHARLKRAAVAGLCEDRRRQ